MHPLINDLEKLKDSELESKLNDLTRKYFATNNQEVQHQITMVIDSYKTELNKRRQDAYEKMMNSRNKDLDKLININ